MRFPTVSRLIAVIPFLWFGYAAAQTPHLTINGSNTIGAELGPALVEGMLRDDGAKNIRVQLDPSTNEHRISAVDANGKPVYIHLNAHGSSTGFKALLDGSGQIAASSRTIRPSEVASLIPQGSILSKDTEQIIALDALAVIVHPDNPITELSTTDIAQLFSGEITDWKQLGGNPGKVRLHARDNNSGTWETFSELVLNPFNATLHSSAQRYESSTELSAAVSSDPNAIGFIGLPYVLEAKAVAVSAGGAQAMLPDNALVATEDYPLSRRLYMYLKPNETNALAHKLIRFTQTEAGQKIVEQKGFISQNIQAMDVTPDDSMPDEYLKLSQEAKRLSVNFRFQAGSATLDNKAYQDVERVLNYLRTHDKTNRKLVLVGFGDSRHDSTAERAELLSKLRAMAVLRQLHNHEVLLKDMIGLGNVMPVASTQIDGGRVKNQRVELWVY